MKRDQRQFTDAAKIAVLRANALGDYIFTLPALHALKNAFPSAELVFLGNAWHEAYLAERPGPVDRVVVVPRTRGIPEESDRPVDPGKVDAFFSAMRAEKFDIALQMHGGGANSNPFVIAIGAKLSAGFCAANAPRLDINIPYVAHHPEILRQLELVATIGAKPTSITPEIPVTRADRIALESELGAPRTPYAVLHPGATDVRRRWPPAKMSALANVLVDRGLDVFVTGVADERDVVAQVVEEAGDRVHDTCGRISLPALTALLQSASIVVANDTGPLHLARAVGASTIGIYWVGNIINSGPTEIRNHRTALSWTTHCPACGMDCIANDAHVARDGCAHDVSFVDKVDVDEIIEKADALLVQPGTGEEMRALSVSR